MVRLDSGQVLTVVAVALLVTSVGVVAATIDSIDTPQGTDGSIQDRTAAESGADDRLNITVSGQETADTEPRQSIDLVFCVAFLQQPPAIGGIALGVVAIAYGLYSRYNAATMGLACSGLLPVVMAMYFLLTNCGPSDGSGGTVLSGTDIVSGGGGITAPQIPPPVLAVVLGGAMIAAVVTMFRMTGGEEEIDPVEPESAEPDAADFARAAGEAADRIEEKNVSVDNAVYDAWLQMTRLVDIEKPDTAAPRALADAAVAAGVERDDARELMELFTEVRYGGKSPEGREGRATEVLRNIEQTYTDEHGHTAAADRGDER